MATLEARIDALERQLTDLTRSSLKLGPQQAGPLPGWFRAAHIEGNQMLINMTDSKAGVSPRISVTDTSGVTRAELGNLADYVGPNGVDSPAQYGFRAIDTTGNNIFDSLGLIAIMKVVGQLDALSGSTPNAFDTQVGSSMPFTVANRPHSFLCLAQLSVQTIGAIAGDTGYFRINVAGSQSGVAQMSVVVPNSASGTVTLFLTVLNLAIGSYSGFISAATDGSATSAGVFDGTVRLYDLGSA